MASAAVRTQQGVSMFSVLLVIVALKAYDWNFLLQELCQLS